MVLRDLSYVILFVEDLERSLEFYLRKVGLEVRYRAEGYAELAVDGPKLALLERWRISEIVGSGEAQRPAPGAHDLAMSRISWRAGRSALTGPA